MKSVDKKNGFTLVELMVALMIASVVFSAVATLAYATSTAKEATDDMGRSQAQLRQVSIRLRDLIKQSNDVDRFDWGSSGGLLLWQDEDVDGDRDDDEYIIVYSYNYIKNGNSYRTLAVRTLKENEIVYKWDHGFRVYRDLNYNGYYETEKISYFSWIFDDPDDPDSRDDSTEVYWQCENPVFEKEGRNVNVYFRMNENGQYSINAHLRVSDDYDDY